MKSLYNWLPDRVDARVRLFGWLSLIGQLVLVASGGAVRLTGSGLGCPTWPRCTADSLTTTPAMGIHGVIEFSNRVLSFILVLVVIAAFLLVLRLFKTRRDLFWITFAAGMSIPAQAVIGGLSVLTELNPYVVGLHFVVSVALVALSAALVVRIYAVVGPRQPAVPHWFALVTWLTALFAAITIVMGILTTGSGPHAGSADAPRNGLNSELLQHLHSLPAYVTFGLTIVLVTAAFTMGLLSVRPAVLGLLIVEFAQIGVGLLQANTGLPGWLVSIHMVLACLLAAAITLTILRLEIPKIQESAVTQNGSSGSIATARNSSVR